VFTTIFALERLEPAAGPRQVVLRRIEETRLWIGTGDVPGVVELANQENDNVSEIEEEALRTAVTTFHLCRTRPDGWVPEVQE
jgi:hypothetical protein